MKESGIYQILNMTNGKCYVGQAGRTLRIRRQEHWRDLLRGKHWNDHLQSAWNLYGEAAFAFEVLEYVPDREKLVEREQYYIDTLHPEYNIAPVAGSQLGIKRSEEANRNNSEAQKGKALSEETKRKIGEASRGRLHSEEDRLKMSAAQKGKPRGSPSLEARVKLSKARRGRTPGAKLTEQYVREIQTLLQDCGLSQREIAARYGVCQATISKIKLGLSWPHISNEGKLPPALSEGVQSEE